MYFSSKRECCLVIDSWTKLCLKNAYTVCMVQGNMSYVPTFYTQPCPRLVVSQRLIVSSILETAPSPRYEVVLFTLIADCLQSWSKIFPSIPIYNVEKGTLGFAALATFATYMGDTKSHSPHHSGQYIFYNVPIFKGNVLYRNRLLFLIII